jgi:hypothetical protein
MAKKLDTDGSPDAADPSSGPTVGGCPLFPAGFPYNQDISKVPLDPGSATYIANLKQRAPVIRAPHGGDKVRNVVPASQPDVSVGLTGSSFGFDTSGTFFHSSSGTASAPIPANVVFQGELGVDGDHHMVVVQQGTCRLFELYSWNPSSPTSGWSLMVTWNLTKNEQLPDGWGSTTAAGTPFLPGVVWRDEVAAGEIKHALDLVLASSAIAAYKYVKPAARSAGACGSTYPVDGFPYGGRVRLKASFDKSRITGTVASVVVRALQKYGWINTDDSGYAEESDWRFEGGVWDTADIDQLGTLTWDDFEVPQMAVVQSTACN